MRVYKKNPSGKCSMKVGDREGNTDGTDKSSSFRDTDYTIRSQENIIKEGAAGLAESNGTSISNHRGNLRVRLIVFRGGHKRSTN